jgi:hypothetical protein
MRSLLYRLARTIGDANAARRGPRAIGKRAERRVLVRIFGRLIGRIVGR